jgi:hypothetical protein
MLQFVLSFGHFHPIETNGTVRADIAGAVTTPAVSHAELTAGDSDHDDHHRSHLAHDLCAICVTMVQAGTALLLSVAPVLPLPPASEPSRTIAAAGLLSIASGHPPFQPRAPPAV